MIKIFDTFFDEREFNLIYNSLTRLPFIYGELDDDDCPPTGMVCDLRDDSEIYSIILNKILKLSNNLDKKLMYRMYINCFAPLENPFFHTDCIHSNIGTTFLFYLNKVWNINDGGETQFFIDDQITGILPIPNRMIAFDSRILHKATSFKDRYRFTIAIKFDQDFQSIDF